MGGRLEAMYGYMSIPEASEYIASTFGETLKDRNQNKYTSLIKKKLQLTKFGKRSWQVKIEDVNSLINELAGEEIVDVKVIDVKGNKNEVNEIDSNKLKCLIELKEDNIIDLQQFYEAIKKTVGE